MVVTRENSMRISYLENELERWMKENPNTFLRTVEARVLKAGKDVFGPDSIALRFLESTLKTGKPKPEKFDDVAFAQGVSCINAESAHVLGRCMAYELLRVYDREIEYYTENNLYHFWECLGRVSFHRALMMAAAM